MTNRRRTTFARKACAVAITCAAAAVAAPTAAVAAGSNGCGVAPDVLIVLDRSGSMGELAGAQSKWSIAKSAVNQLTGSFGKQLKFGMVLLPTYPDADSCGAGSINVKPALSNKTSISTLLSQSYPKGNTPIAGSLDQVLAHVQSKTWVKPPRVVLITDGKETCRSAPAPLNAGGSCQWNGGSNYRKCGGCGWQFCLKTGKWSSACEPAPTMFPCRASQTCGSDALCKGPQSGSDTPQQAAKKLSALGIDTYVVGFGAEIDAKALTALAVAGGTTRYHQADNLAQLNMTLTQIAKAISCCGNGALDAGELCDPAAPAGQAGACPTTCDDGDPCTADSKDGLACNVKCVHKPITAAINGDGCCPTGANSGNDTDCKPSCGNGVVDPGETCDPGIPAGQAGACDQNCDDNDPCTVDALGGAACAPKCTHKPAAADPLATDGCCPTGLTSKQDADCLPPCSPDRTTNCVDMCQSMKCPDGQYCKLGRCEPWPQDNSREGYPVGSGCDCRAGGRGAAARAQSFALMVLLFGGLIVVRRLRRRRRRR